MAYVTIEVNKSDVRIGKTFVADSVAGAMALAVDWAVNGEGERHNSSDMRVTLVYPGGSDGVRTAATNKFRIDVSQGRWQRDADKAASLQGFGRGQTPPPRYPVTINDLMAWRRQNPTVAAHFELWQSGSFPTFEQMLVSLACHLAHEVAELLQSAQMRITEQPGPIVTKESP